MLGSVLVACFLQALPAGLSALEGRQAMAATDQKSSSSSAISKPSQIYFPGDVVHIVVEAPVDTDSVSAVMPDSQELSMVFDRRAKIWHNYWQVPMGFKKGVYTAKLTAVDVEGRNFKGETAPIFVDEPTLPVVMRFAPSEEVRPAPVAARAKVKPKEEIKIAKKPSVKAKKRIAVLPKEDFNTARMRYITSARDFLAKQEYEKAKVQLEALLDIDPGNTEVKLMLSRIESIIKARKTI